MFASFVKEMEESAGRMWEKTIKDPRTLESMGSMLTFLCGAKERSDRALEEAWAHARLPSAADVQRLFERLGEIDERLARLEERLATPEAAAVGGERAAR
jgi:hypothetical protein